MPTNRRLVLTRTAEDNAALRRMLGGIDATIVDYPCIRVELLSLPEKIRRDLQGGAFDAAVFVSRHSAEVVIDASAPAPRQVMALGSATERAVRERGWRVTSRPSRALAEVAAREIDALLPGVERVLYPRGDLGDELIAQALSDRGVRVEQVVVYRTASAIEAPLPPFDGVTLTVFASPSAVRFFFAANARGESMEILAIGPTTARACQERAIACRLAPSSTTEGLAQGIRDWLRH